jgi:hypothetical protein
VDTLQGFLVLHTFRHPEEDEVRREDPEKKIVANDEVTVFTTE